MTTMKYRTFVHEAHELNSISDLKQFVVTIVRNILKHEMTVFGIGDLKNRRAIRFINIDFPDRYLDYAVLPNQNIQCHLMHKWLETQQPLVFHDNQNDCDIDAKWIEVLKSCRIQSMASHGLVDPSNQIFSYFGFGNVDSSTDDIHTRLVELTPILHYALTRVLTLNHNTATVNSCSEKSISSEKVLLLDNKENSSAVTPRETEILSWISLGKRNEDIAQILGISQHTVNNHIKSIFKRLDVTSRAQAVSKACSLSLIENHPA